LTYKQYLDYKEENGFKVGLLFIGNFWGAEGEVDHPKQIINPCKLLVLEKMMNSSLPAQKSFLGLASTPFFW